MAPFAAAAVVLLAAPIGLVMVDAAAAEALSPTVAILTEPQHGDAATGDEIIRMLRTIQAGQPGVACIFLETDAKAYTAIDDYVNGRSSYDDSVRAELHRQELIVGGPVANSIPQSLLDAFPEVRFLPVDAELESDLGRRVVDLLGRFNWSDGRFRSEYARVMVEERSSHIADAIANAFRQGLCRQSGAVIIGEGHVLRAYGGVAVTPIQDFLGALGVAPTLIDPHDQRKGNSTWR